MDLRERIIERDGIAARRGATDADVTAARAGARIACITAALDVAAACHPPQRVDETHCAGRQKQLLESVEDARARIVLCVGREDALVIREAATRAERRDPAALRRGA